MKVAQMIEETKRNATRMFNVRGYDIPVGSRSFQTDIGIVTVRLELSGTSGQGNKRPGNKANLSLDGKRISRKKLEDALS